jgi:hypothetical protein
MINISKIGNNLTRGKCFLGLKYPKLGPISFIVEYGSIVKEI